jgi:hypothetical protein
LKRHGAQGGQVKMAVNLKDKRRLAVPFHHQRRIESGQIRGVKDNIHNRASDGMNNADRLRGGI